MSIESAPTNIEIPEGYTILYDELQVERRIDEMAAEIVVEYNGINPLFVCLLRGANPYASMLMRSIARQDHSFNPEMDYLTIRTYGDERESKPPKIIQPLAPSTVTRGRHAIILDDVLDKGDTAEFTTKYLTRKGVSSVDLIVLAEKQKQRQVYHESTKYGFLTPDVWLAGMGMDNTSRGKEFGRWAGYIAVANAID
jgi:hypoxanthine phosphoribosyltransferase